MNNKEETQETQQLGTVMFPTKEELQTAQQQQTYGNIPLGVDPEAKAIYVTGGTPY